jgi:erythromycin esterase-like protein
MKMRTPPCPASSASRTGCGAIPTSPTSSTGCAATTKNRLTSRQVGFYGLDLYSLFTSIARSAGYLDKVDPAAAAGGARALRLLRPLLRRQPALRLYGQPRPVRVLRTRRDRAAEPDAAARLRLHAGGRREDAFFYAQQNARLVKNAEEYYRTMFRGRISSWNLRDSHMAETLDALAQHLSKDGEPAKIVVWEHNSHIGDARATEVGEQGEWNVGQLAREAYDGQTRLIGFSTYDGFVTAASEWDGDAEHKRVNPGMPGSYEELLHDTASRASCCRCATMVRRASPCCSAPGTRDRRASTCRAPSARAIIFRPRWRASSTP